MNVLKRGKQALAVAMLIDGATSRACIECLKVLDNRRE